MSAHFLIQILTMWHMGMIHRSHIGQVGEMSVCIDLWQLIVAHQILAIKVGHVLLWLVTDPRTMTTPPVRAHDVVGVESSAETDKDSIYSIQYIHIIIIITWSGVLYHVEWMRSYHRITRDAKLRGWSHGMTSSTRCDTVCLIKLLLQ